MNVFFIQLTVLYAVIGVGCAAAMAVRGSRRASDAVMMVGLWPLLAPFWLAPARTAPALAPAGLADLLPTPEAIDRLRARLEAATARKSEIDTLLSEPELSLESVEARIDELTQRGASKRALGSAESRKKSILGLMRRRKMLAGELEDLAELFLQLKTQSEVVRLAGTPISDGDSVGELVADIQARLEGLDELLEEEL